MCRLKDVSSSLFSFMSLFDDVKKLLATTDSHDGVVDVDMKGSIFGKKMTYLQNSIQVVYLLTQIDYI